VLQRLVTREMMRLFPETPTKAVPDAMLAGHHLFTCRASNAHHFLLVFAVCGFVVVPHRHQTFSQCFAASQFQSIRTEGIRAFVSHRKLKWYFLFLDGVARRNWRLHLQALNHALCIELTDCFGMSFRPGLDRSGRRAGSSRCHNPTTTASASNHHHYRRSAAATHCRQSVQKATDSSLCVGCGKAKKRCRCIGFYDSTLTTETRPLVHFHVHCSDANVTCVSPSGLVYLSLPSIVCKVVFTPWALQLQRIEQKQSTLPHKHNKRQCNGRKKENGRLSMRS
jgi:hypothetical protein